MINNFQYQKNVEDLRARMRRIQDSYRRAYWYSFYGGLLLFILQLAYLVIRMVLMSRAWMLDHFDDDAVVPYEWTVFLPNLVPLFASLICFILGQLSFKMKQRIIKMIFFFMQAAFSIGCIFMLLNGSDLSTFSIALIYTAGLIALTIDCFVKDTDDARLSLIDGYPYFDSLLMNDIEPDLEAREKIRFHDKGEAGYEKLIDDRDEIYLENNPNSETAKLKRQEKEEKREKEISDWLDDMMMPK